MPGTLVLPRILGGALFLSIALSILSIATPPPDRAEALTNCDVTDLSLDQDETAFLKIINDYRAQYGLQPLALSQDLNRSATWMATDMATKNYFAHGDSSGRLSQSRIADCGGSLASGENLGAGTNIISAAQAFDLWRTSPSHNSNMLYAAYRRIGIARVSLPGSYYTNYWVTTFDTLAGGATATGASPAPAAALIDPAPGSSLASHAYVFRWTSAPGIYEYWLDVGTCPSCNDLYSASSGLGTAAMVVNLPRDGRQFYVRLSMRTARGWGFVDYTFTAANFQ